MSGQGLRTRGPRQLAASSDFDHALMREVMRTELIRIKVLGFTVTFLIIAVCAFYLIDPPALEQIWRGRLKPHHFLFVLIPFIAFELWVYMAVRRHLKLDRDLPVFRRYLGVLIETSMPTVVLALHMDSMGSMRALGFVIPLVYFIFIILSTLRLDFWLSTFTGFVAASQLFAMAMFYRPAIDADPTPDVWFHGARSMILLVCGILAGTVGAQLRRQFAASIQAVTARDRVTNLFGQHVSPQVAERLLRDGAPNAKRYPPGRRDVRRLSQLHRGLAFALSAGGRGSPRRRVCGAGGNP
jgi:adenylate cyclase